jgi:hypothetical protein
MTYFVGEALHVRVKHSGLSQLYELLKGVADGTEEWPQTCYISVADKADLSPLRNLLYSILTELSIKQDFSIKAVGEQLILDQKRPANTKKFGVRFGDSYLAPTSPSLPHTTPNDTYGQEFDLSDPELFPLASPTQTAEGGAVPGLEYDPADRDDADPLVRQFLQVAELGKNSPIYKTFHRNRLILDSPETYEPDRQVAEGKVAAERRNMEKAVRAAGLLATPLPEEVD